MAKWSSVGAVGSALGFSLTWFCCLPIAFGALSGSVAAAGNFLGPWQPYLAGLSLVFLGVAVGQAVRKERQCRAGTCPLEGRRRRWIVLTMVTIVVLIMITIPYWSSHVIFWLL